MGFKELRMDQTRNVEAVDSTLQMLTAGKHRIKRNPDGTVFVDAGGAWIIETTNPGFCEFACKNQGYADILPPIGEGS